MFYSVRVFGQVLVPAAQALRVDPVEGPTAIALQESSKTIVPGTPHLGHPGGLTLRENGRAAGQTGLVPFSHHRHLFLKKFLLKIAKIGEACIIIVQQVKIIIKEVTTWRRLQVSTGPVQVEIRLTFTYSDGTTGEGTTTVELEDDGSATIDFQLSDDETNGAGTGLCAGCSYVLEAIACVDNCDDYGKYDTSGNLDYEQVVSRREMNLRIPAWFVRAYTPVFLLFLATRGVLAMLSSSWRQLPDWQSLLLSREACSWNIRRAHLFDTPAQSNRGLLLIVDCVGVCCALFFIWGRDPWKFLALAWAVPHRGRYAPRRQRRVPTALDHVQQYPVS